MNLIPTPSAAGGFMAMHSRSFRFASLTLGAESRGRVERVYAWCRHTDNIVDNAVVEPNAVDGALDEWLGISRRAFDGETSSVPLVDLVMADLRHSGGSFDVVEALVRGVRSDLHFQPYVSLDALRVYTRDVAAVVGRWLCALHSISDPWLLHRAEALGHAMQLTNILRDVGEDLDAGRIYLPLDMLRERYISPLDLHRMRSGNLPILPGYKALIEDLIARADADYALAWEAIPHLPREFGSCVGVAARIYGGIHEVIRANAYDNFTRRAHTSMATKMWLAAGALAALQRHRASSWLPGGSLYRRRLEPGGELGARGAAERIISTSLVSGASTQSFGHGRRSR
jgi:phytoene synthase